MHTRTLASILLWTLSAPLLGQRPTAPLVPPEMLDGQRLIDADAHFSISAPENWIWLTIPSERVGFKNYGASNPDRSLGYAVDVITTDFAMTPDNAKDVEIGMAKKLRARGLHVELLAFTPVDYPVERAYTFSWRVLVPDKSILGCCEGEVLYRFGYLLKHKESILAFTCFAKAPTEPALFSTFVRSLRVY
jgi:hypothetical protein